MIIKKEHYTGNCIYPLERLGIPEKLLFFDIETTGFSSKTASLYLIGCLSWHKGEWTLMQWMAERFIDEQHIVKAFADYCKDFDTLIHFNGDTFDLPFLRKCAEHYSLSLPFDQMKSIDLLKRIRPLKNILSLTDLKLKTIEQFLSINREDSYTGGELISIYHSYEKSHDPRLESFLLLHNKEDIKNMPALLPVLYYTELPQIHFSIQEVHQTEHILTILAVCDCLFPVSIQLLGESASFSIDGCHLQMKVPISTGELYYFYPDYRNYYYLPLEGYAIHKKIACFVDSEHRIKAAPETAFAKHTGEFLPVGNFKKGICTLETEIGPLPLLKTSYSSKENYTLYRQEDDFLQWYLSYQLEALLHRKK